MFKRTRQNSLSIFTNSQDYCDLPKRIIGANGSIYYIFKSTKHREVQNLCQDKAGTDMTLS